MKDIIDYFALSMLFTLFLTLLMADNVGAVTNLGGCSQIMSPGEYVLTANVANSNAVTCIYVTSDDVIFDGGGKTIDGNDAANHFGVYVVNSSGIKNVTVKNLILTDWYTGVYYWRVTNGTIENINASSNDVAIKIYSFSSGINVTDNNLSSNNYGLSMNTADNSNIISNTANSNRYTGIYVNYGSNDIYANNTANSNNDNGIEFLGESEDETLFNNTANSNGELGIYVYDSKNFNLTYNTMSGNRYGFSVNALESDVWDYISHFQHNIDTTNTVDGKPVYYLIGNSSSVIDSSFDMGYYGIISCDNITVKDLTFTNKYQGVLFVNTTDSSISNVTANGSYYGIFLHSSEGNNITNSNISSNLYGFYAYESDNGNFFNNTVNSNAGGGIWLSYSNFWNMENNTVNFNSYGFMIGISDNNNVINNTVNSNDYGIDIEMSDSNMVSRNRVRNSSTCGVKFESDDTRYNNITENIISSITWEICVEGSSTDNYFYNNYINGSSCYLEPSANFWNLTKRAGTNIAGGSYIGGNFWAKILDEEKPDPGFSFTCRDDDADGICDSSYAIDSSNIDYLPLAYSTGQPGPYIAINTPQNISYNTLNLTINATVADGSGVNVTKAEINGLVNITLYPCGGNNYNNTYTFNEGQNFVKIYANDSQGHANSSDTVFFNIDLVDPVAESGANPVNNYNSSGTVAFELSCSDNEEVSTVQLWSDWAGSWSANQTNTSYANGSGWSIEVQDIPGGTWRWAVWCNDSSGRSNITSNRTLTIDTLPPAYSGISDNSSGVVGDGAIVGISVYWEDGLNLDSSIFRHNASGWANISSHGFSGSGSYFNTTIDTSGMEGKTICWNQWANDSVGNWNKSMSGNCFLVRNIIPPSIGNASLNASQINKNGVARLNATVADVSPGVDKVLATFMNSHGIKANKTLEYLWFYGYLYNSDDIEPGEVQKIGYTLESTDFTHRTCSGYWGKSCKTGPPETGLDNTFNGCGNGNGADESVDEIYLNATNVTAGTVLQVTCEYDPYTSGDYLNIQYFDGVSWHQLYDEDNTGSGTVINRSVIFVVNNTLGQHVVRCGISYDCDDDDSCSNCNPDYYDNDDMNFTVVQNYRDNESSKSPTEYQDINATAWDNVTMINVTVYVSYYNDSGSVMDSNNNPDLYLEIYNGSGWTGIGAFNVNGVGNFTKSASQDFNWGAAANRDIRISGIYFDANGSATYDQINWTGVYVSVEYDDQPNNWYTYVWTDTSESGTYYVTDIYANDTAGNMNHTAYADLYFAVRGASSETPRQYSSTSSSTASRAETVTKEVALIAGEELKSSVKLQESLKDVLEIAEMDTQAMENLVKNSETISPDITASRELSVSGGKSRVITEMSYKGKDTVKNFIVYESLPKSFASKASLVAVNASGAAVKVVEEDPSWIMIYPEIKDGDKIIIQYEVAGEKNSSLMSNIKSEVYAESIEGIEAPVASKICIPSENRCSGDYLQVCSSDGLRWSNLERCAYGCVPATPVCNQAPPAAQAESKYSMDILSIILLAGLIVAVVFLLAYPPVRSKKPAKTRKHAEKSKNMQGRLRNSVNIPD